MGGPCPPHKFQLAQAWGGGQVAAPETDQLFNVQVVLMSPGHGLPHREDRGSTDCNSLYRERGNGFAASSEHTTGGRWEGLSPSMGEDPKNKMRDGSNRFSAREILPAKVMGSTEIRSSDRDKDFSKLTVLTVQLAWSAEKSRMMSMEELWDHW